MSDATKAMRDFLTKSPSVVFPDEVLELFIPVERENERLRELVSVIWMTARLMDANKHIEGMRITDDFRAECERAFDELGIKET